jgi:aryl-alcohol dehydrogenase (NADP+)
MEYVNMGSTGLKVSRICLGCMSFGKGMDWMITEEESKAIVKRALDAGINFFDTADVYSRGVSEEILGRALKGCSVQRDRVVIATKVCGAMGDDPNQRGLSRKHIMHSIDDSLRRLGTDYIDLYQIHRFDASTPITETLEALTDVVKAGKVRYIGGSSMWAWQFAKMLYTSDRLGLARFVTMQNQYNLLYREEEREMNPLCRAEGVGLIPWSPIAGGLLAGTRRAGTVRSKMPFGRDRFTRPSDDRVIDAVATVAAQRGVKPAEVAIAWLLAQPGMTAPIIGVTKLAQIEDPIKAVETKLTADEIKTLTEHYVPQAVAGHM